MPEDRSGPPLILPPGARALLADAVGQALDPNTLPHLERVIGLNQDTANGRAMVLQLHVRTSTVAGILLALPLLNKHPLPELAQLLRETASALDRIAADHAQAHPDPTPDPNTPT